MYNTKTNNSLIFCQLDAYERKRARDSSLSCFVQLKSVLFNLLCAFSFFELKKNFFFRTLAVNPVSDFYVHKEKEERNDW